VHHLFISLVLTLSRTIYLFVGTLSEPPDALFDHLSSSSLASKKREESGLFFSYDPLSPFLPPDTLSQRIDDVLCKRALELDSVENLVGIRLGRGASEETKVEEGLNLFHRAS
jgi:hypothetical protein